MIPISAFDNPKITKRFHTLKPAAQIPIMHPNLRSKSNRS
jgi:hypothetical protein